MWSPERKIQARKSNLQLSVRFTRMIGFDTTVYHTKEDKKNHIISTTGDNFFVYKVDMT